MAEGTEATYPHSNVGYAEVTEKAVTSLPQFIDHDAPVDEMTLNYQLQRLSDQVGRLNGDIDAAEYRLRSVLVPREPQIMGRGIDPHPREPSPLTSMVIAVADAFEDQLIRLGLLIDRADV